MRSAAGSNAWDDSAIPMHGIDGHCRLRRPIVRVCASRSLNCKSSPTRPARHPRPPLSARHIEMEQVGHRLFCHVAQAWRAAVDDRLAVVGDRGDDHRDRLKVEGALDTRSYQKGIKVSRPR